MEKWLMARGELARRVTERVQEGRSEVYKWLLANYADVAKAVAIRGSWEALKEAATEAGVRIDDRKGGGKANPTVPALRSAWSRVLADKGVTKAQKPTRRAKVPVESALPATPAAALSSPPLVSPATPRPRNPFEVARIKRAPTEESS
jgi:hypothetical protein